MKQIFNAAGVAQVQANQLLLSPTDLAASMLALQTNFSDWMNTHFILSASQQSQIDTLSSLFKEELAHAIADELVAGKVITFAKDEAKGGKDDKEVLMMYSSVRTYTFNTSSIQSDRTLQILIRYR